MTVKHAHQTALPDTGSDVSANEWNADHSITTDLSPDTTDAASLGTTSKMWSDLFLASGAVINYNNGDVTITHAADTLGIEGGNVVIGAAAAQSGPFSITQVFQVHGTTNASLAFGKWSANTLAPIFYFNKSRGASVGSHTIVQAGDVLGIIDFSGSDGSKFVLSADILAVVEGTPATDDVRARLGFETGNVERMRIDSAGITSLGIGNYAATLRAYNTYTDASNYERGVFDWTTTANTLTIGFQSAGTGTDRAVQILGAQSKAKILLAANGALTLDANGWGITTGGTIAIINNDTQLRRVAAKVLEVGDGGGANAWIQWHGQTRVAADVATATTAFAVATGLTVNVQAGRTYSFEANLQMTDAAAGGVKAKIGGTCTATAIQYTGWAVADNAIKAKTNATALDTTVASTLTTETSGIVIQIYGTITVNVAGTLNVQYAQDTSNAVATTVKRGSYFIVHDMP